jgi:hypothetical protein
LLVSTDPLKRQTKKVDFGRPFLINNAGVGIALSGLSGLGDYFPQENDL